MGKTILLATPRIQVDHELTQLGTTDTIIILHKIRSWQPQKLLDVPLDLLTNLNVEKLIDGVSRIILPGANSD